MIEYFYSNYIDIIAALIGLVFLYLEFRANIWMWFVSILMALLFIYTFFVSHLYASMCIYIYFLGASFYGWVTWYKTRKKENSDKDIILRMPLKKVGFALLFLVLALGCIYRILDFTDYENTYLRFGDALTTALNVVALWMASRKWAEQWILLVPANVISGILLHLQQNYATSFMFYIYALVSIAGFYHWKKLSEVRSDS